MPTTVKKALYGLKRAPRAWYQQIDNILITKLGYKRCASNSNLYVHKEGGKCTVIAIYVDDLIPTGDQRVDALD